MTTPAPTKEIGYAQTPIMSTSGTASGQWWMLEDETTPELRWPNSVFVYDQMRRQDSQVVSVLRAVTLPVRRTPWRIDPAGARDEVVQLIAEDLGLPIVGREPKPMNRTGDRFSWPDHLREALLMLPFGHSYFEQVYRIVDGLARLRKLSVRMPKTIEEIEVARDGGLISITQYALGGGVRETPIPVSRLVAYIHEKEAGNWLGASLLRPAYKNWLLKDRLLRVQAQTIERNGMGIPVYEAAPTERDLSKGLALATSLRAGEAAGAAIPAEAKLRLMGVEGELPDAEPAIRYHDEQIGRAVLAHFLNLGTQTGSWALGSTFADFFTLSLQTLAQQIADVATQHIVEDLVDLNFGEGEPAPRIVFDEIGSRQASTAEAIRALVETGVITPDEVLEGAVRQQFGLPPKSTDAEPVVPPQETDTEDFDDESSVHASAGQIEPDSDVDDDPIGELDDETFALLEAMHELDLERGLVQAAWNPEQHRRWPRGHPKAGKFRPMVTLLKMAIAKHDGKGHPFEHFSREQLRKAAKTRGITLRRGEDRDSIADKLLADLSGPPTKPAVPARKAAKKAATPAERVQTWEELGRPQGPPPVGQRIGHEGGTYELLPGEPRRYRVITSDGRDISDQMSVGIRRKGGRDIPGNQTAEDARTALRMDAFDRQRAEADANSEWRGKLEAITGSWSYGSREVSGFDAATPAQRIAIRDALARWTENKLDNPVDATRVSEPMVNAAIRGAVPHTEELDNDIRAMDLAFTMSKTKRRMGVARGFSNGQHILPADWETRDLTGLEWTNEGFTPVTGDPEAAEAYIGDAADRGFGIVFDLPRGAPAIAIPDAIGGLDNEGEIILPRGMSFRVVRDNGPQGELGLRKLEVKIVRRRTPAGDRRSRSADVPGTAENATAPTKKAAKKAAPLPVQERADARTVMGTDFSPAMHRALTDIEDSGGLQQQRADFQVEYDLSDEEMDRLVDDGFVEVDDSAGGGGYIAATPRGVRALAELGAGRTAAEPAKKATKKAVKKAATPAKKAAKRAAKKAAAPVQPRIPGVTLDRIPQVFGDAPDAYRVNHNGVDVGTVHGNEADDVWGWTPFTPANASWQLRDPDSKPTREAAIKELVDSYNEAHPSAAPSATPAANVPTEEELDQLPYRDFRDLAIEHGIDLYQPRTEMIRQIREKMGATGGRVPTGRHSGNPQPPQPVPAPATPLGPQDKLIGSLIPTSSRDGDAREAEIKRVLEERLNGQYAGLTVKVTGVGTSRDNIDMEADILDANGNLVGQTNRSFRRDSDGKLWVYHAYLSLRPEVQGQGFAEAWNSHLMDWYTESGVDRVEVTANIDVGGYTWARQGFDFKNQNAASDVANRLRTQLTYEANRRQYDADQLAAAESVLDRMRNLRFGDPNFPTAYEVSQAGRKPGQGRTDGWPGKNAMLGSYWSGVKPVPAPSGARPVS